MNHTEKQSTLARELAEAVITELNNRRGLSITVNCDYDADMVSEVTGALAGIVAGILEREHPLFVRGEPRIVCSAVRHLATGDITLGARHHHCFWRVAEGVTTSDYEQGFIDQFEKFHTREEAHKIATAKGQIIARCGGDAETLYSENLY